MKTKLASLVFCLSLSILPTASHAQSFSRTFVSGLGNDGNPCTRTQPCQTFTRALAQTFAGGEIDVLDPGGYGPFTITKAISIINDGVGVAGVKPAAGANAIIINAGTNDSVNLQGLTIEGASTGGNGIVFVSGKSLTVSKSKIRNFAANGIVFTPNSTAALSVQDTIVESNAGNGILVQPSTNVSNCFAVFTRVKSDQNGNNGISINGGNVTGFNLQAAAIETTASLNGNYGYYAVGTASFANVVFYLTKSYATFNGVVGVYSDNNSFFLMAQSGIDSSSPTTQPMHAASGGHLVSYGDNYGDGFSAGVTAGSKF